MHPFSTLWKHQQTLEIRKGALGTNGLKQQYIKKQTKSIDIGDIDAEVYLITAKYVHVRAIGVWFIKRATQLICLKICGDRTTNYDKKESTK